jgi:hypothetical protein
MKKNSISKLSICKLTLQNLQQPVPQKIKGGISGAQHCQSNGGGCHGTGNECETLVSTCYTNYCTSQ